MSCNHSHTGLPHKLCEPVTLAQRRLEDRSSFAAAAPLAWRNGVIDTYGKARFVDPDQVEREPHPDHVDRPGPRQEEGVTGRQLIRAEQSAEATAEGSGDVDDFARGQHDVR